MSEIKFSVVVPTYGVANYITDSLGCLMHQTYDNFEVIVVDDCSPDRSGEIAKSFVERDDRFIYVRHEKNMGVSAARNTGIERATGSYILFLDPDDTYETHMLSVLARTLSRNPVDVLVFGHTEDYRDGDTGKVEYTKKITLADLSYDDDAFSTNDLVTIHKTAMEMERVTMLGYPWNKAYKLSVIKENNVRFRKIKHVEDILFNCDFLDFAKSMTIVADILYHYRNQGQVRLTGGQIDNYFDLQCTRVRRIYDQQQQWKTCDFEALSVLASEYFRSFQSNIVRMLEAGKSKEEIIDWCKEEAKSELFNDLKRHLHSNAKAVKLLYQPIADEDFEQAIKRSKLIAFVRNNMSGVYNRVKQIR